MVNNFLYDQVLYENGGRKFGFLSLSPLGCLPALRNLNPNKESEGGCFEAGSALAAAHNNALKGVLANIEYLFKDFKFANSDFYSWLEDRMNNPSNYGMYPPFIITYSSIVVESHIVSYIENLIFHIEYCVLYYTIKYDF